MKVSRGETIKKRYEERFQQNAQTKALHEKKSKKKVRGCPFLFLFKNANILKLTSFINLRVCAMHADIPFFYIRSDFNVLKLFVFVIYFFFITCVFIRHVERRKRWCVVSAVATSFFIVIIFVFCFFSIFCYSAHMNDGYNVHTW